jgi:hypothetical protein
MGYKRKRQFKKKFFKKKRFYPAIPRTAFSSNKSTMVKLTTSLSLQALQLKYGHLVFSTHAPVFWKTDIINPITMPNVLVFHNFYRITNALAQYESAYLSSLKISILIPSQQNTSYQFLRNNIPIALDEASQILTAQITQLS